MLFQVVHQIPSGGGQGVPDIDFDRLYKDVSEQNTGADIAENIPYVGTFCCQRQCARVVNRC